MFAEGKPDSLYIYACACVKGGLQTLQVCKIRSFCMPDFFPVRKKYFSSQENISLQLGKNPPPVEPSFPLNFQLSILNSYAFSSHFHEEERTLSSLLSRFGARSGHQSFDALGSRLSSPDGGAGNRRLSSLAEAAHLAASAIDYQTLGRPVKRNPAKPTETHKRVFDPSYFCTQRQEGS